MPADFMSYGCAKVAWCGWRWASAILAREADGRALAARRGYPSTSAWLREQLRMSHGQARRLLGLGRVLDQRPVLAAAVMCARVGVEQAAVIGAALDPLRERVEAAIVDKAEAALIDHAGQLPPASIARLGQRILAHVAAAGRRRAAGGAVGA
jgi:hypothetical protein